MNKQKIVIICLCLVVLLTGGLVYYFNTDETDVVTYSTYEGKAYLNETEYELFKQLLAYRQDVTIMKLDALSSPNTLVDFKFRVDGNAEFPYGERHKHYKENVFQAIYLVMFAVIGGGFIAFLIFSSMFLLRDRTD